MILMILTFLGTKYFLGGLIFLVTLLAGFIPFKKKRKSFQFDFPTGETLATGVFLGAGLLHMLPEANQGFNRLGYHYPFAFLIAGTVFLLFLWLEHIGKALYHHEDKPTPAFVILALGMLCVHSFVLGTALGMNHEKAVIMMLFLAIIGHKWAESFAISLALNKSTLSSHIALILFIVFALMTPFGILSGALWGNYPAAPLWVNPVLIAISAGTFLYLGTLHGLERCVLVERCCNLRDFSFVMVGFGVMALVAYYL